jgi:hypothetical protein
MAQRNTSPRPNTARGRSRRWPWILLGVVVVVLIGAFVWKVAGDQSQTAAGAATGSAVPSVSFPSTSDHPIALTDYRGKKLVVYFYEGST